jgi:hypothetical protein
MKYCVNRTSHGASRAAAEHRQIIATNTESAQIRDERSEEATSHRTSDWHLVGAVIRDRLLDAAPRV